MSPPKPGRPTSRPTVRRLLKLARDSEPVDPDRSRDAAPRRCWPTTCLLWLGLAGRRSGLVAPRHHDRPAAWSTGTTSPTAVTCSSWPTPPSRAPATATGARLSPGLRHRVRAPVRAGDQLVANAANGIAPAAAASTTSRSRRADGEVVAELRGRSGTIDGRRKTSSDRGLPGRRRPHPDRALRRCPGRRTPRRPRRARVARLLEPAPRRRRPRSTRSCWAARTRPARTTATSRGWRCCSPGSRTLCRHDGQPAVRLGARRGRHRGPAGARRRGRPRGGRRRREHEPGAVRDGQGPAAYDRNVAVHDTTLGWRFVNPALERLTAPTRWPRRPRTSPRSSDLARRPGRLRAALPGAHAPARGSGRLAEEIVPVPVPQRRAASRRGRRRRAPAGDQPRRWPGSGRVPGAVAP